MVSAAIYLAIAVGLQSIARRFLSLRALLIATALTSLLPGTIFFMFLVNVRLDSQTWASMTGIERAYRWQTASAFAMACCAIWFSYARLRGGLGTR